MVENLARVGRKFDLDQIQANSSQPSRANSSQVGGQTIPNSIEVVNLARVGLSWEDRLARALLKWKYSKYIIIGCSCWFSCASFA